MEVSKIIVDDNISLPKLGGRYRPKRKQKSESKDTLDNFFGQNVSKKYPQKYFNPHEDVLWYGKNFNR